jgi:putative transposase
MDAMWTKKAEELAQELATQATCLEDLNGVMRALMKTALEKMLHTELEVHLGRGSSTAAAALGEPENVSSPESPSEARGPRNRKNGTSEKTIPGDLRKLPRDVPRDRQGTFQPQLIGKHQRGWRASRKRFWRSTPRV